MKIKVSTSQHIFNVCNIIFMLIVSVIMIYPLWYVLCASFSESSRLVAHEGFLLVPDGASTAAYQAVFKNPMIVKGYVNTLIVVISGVALNIVITSIAAYCLSQQNLLWSKLLMKIIILTMYFSGGLIPMYLLVSRTMHLNNSYLALILPTAISTYNLIIMRTSFLQLPVSLIESAKLDGATHMQILYKIVIPLSKSIIAVITLYYAVGHWNSWFPASIYIKDREKFPLQLILREILIQNDTYSMAQDMSASDQYAIGENIKYAIIVVATIPILCIYPFLQRYFTKGVMIGAVKG